MGAVCVSSRTGAGLPGPNPALLELRLVQADPVDDSLVIPIGVEASCTVAPERHNAVGSGPDLPDLRQLASGLGNPPDLLPPSTGDSSSRE